MQDISSETSTELSSLFSGENNNWKSDWNQNQIDFCELSDYQNFEKTDKMNDFLFKLTSTFLESSIETFGEKISRVVT